MEEKNKKKERFVLLMSEQRGAWAALEAKETDALLREYFAWVDDLATRGIFQGGEGLQDTGRQMKIVDGIAVDGPFAETKEVIAGFFLLEVGGEEEALGIARSCPALGHGRRLFLLPWCSEPSSRSSFQESGPRQGCFLLVCFESRTGLRALSPQGQETLLLQTMVWLEGMKATQVFRYGEAFEAEGLELYGKSVKPVQTPERATAIYALAAASLEEALSMARSYPGLHHGAILDIQPVWYVDAERARLL